MKEQEVIIGGVRYYSAATVTKLVDAAKQQAAGDALVKVQTALGISAPTDKTYINPSARKLSDADVRRIRANAEGWSGMKWAAHFNLSPGAIYQIKNKQSYRDVV